MLVDAKVGRKSDGGRVEICKQWSAEGKVGIEMEIGSRSPVCAWLACECALRVRLLLLAV